MGPRTLPVVSTQPPITVSEPEWDRGLWWMVLASGTLHLAAVGLLLLVPHTFLHHPPPLTSYTVDLVAPDKVGGTNLIRGGKGRVEAPPMAAAAPPKEEAKPPPPKVEPPKPPPVEVAKPVPPPEPPKAEEKPKADELALAEKTKKSEPLPTATAEPPAAPTAAPRKPPPTVAPTIDTQAEKAAADAKVRAAKEAQAKAAKEAEAKAAKEAAQAKAAKEAADKADAETKAKAAADAKAAKEAADAKARDDRIAAAVRRVQAQAGARGGGTGTKPGDQPGGALSVGPGEGSGGVVKGVEYLMYRNQLESRIKQNWAWAGAGRSLEAAIHFSISEKGEVTDVRITKSSGDSAYDASVERAVRAANPLPPPPEQYRKEFSDVEYTFSPESLQM